MQVLKRRNKVTMPCSEGVPEDDEDFYNMAMHRIGCRPSFLKSSFHLPDCSSKEPYQKYMKIIGDRMGLGDEDDNITVIPCLSLEELDYTFNYQGYSAEDVQEMYQSEPDLSDILLNVTSAFKLEFNIRLKKLQLISMVRKYDIEALIGNAGKLY